MRAAQKEPARKLDFASENKLYRLRESSVLYQGTTLVG
jgi:hypothetical protein